jgi:hypothetical protein
MFCRRSSPRAILLVAFSLMVPPWSTGGQGRTRALVRDVRPCCSGRHCAHAQVVEPHRSFGDPGPARVALVPPAAVRETHSAVVFMVGTESVVLDASWTAERHRTVARSIAGRTETDLFELRCSAVPDMTALRMRRRLGAGGGPSDATPEIAAQMSLAQDPPRQSSTPAPISTRRSKGPRPRGTRGARDRGTSRSGTFGPGSRPAPRGEMSS